MARSSKRSKFSKEIVIRISGDDNGVCEGSIDRLSTLEDSLLSNILSWLPAKLAVSTSILSTRWKYVWTKVTRLDFDYMLNLLDRHHPGIKRTNHHVMLSKLNFMHFVNRVLVLLKPHSLKHFRLRCDKQWVDTVNVSSWVLTALLLHDLQELDLCIHLEQPLDLHLCQFSCESTLVFLKLEGRINFQVPASSSSVFPNLKILHLFRVDHWKNEFVLLPNLKVLRLYWVKYANDDSVRLLFRGCPVLENLDIKRDEVDGVLTFDIYSPTLKSLALHFVWARGDHRHKLQLNTPALEHLRLVDYVFLPSIKLNLSSLLEAFIDVSQHQLVRRDQEVDVDYASAVQDLISKLGTVKFLSLSNSTMMALRSASDNVAPVFSNLTRLKVSICKCRDWLVLIRSLLQTSNNLEHLVCMQAQHIIVPSSHEPWWCEPQCVPRSFSSRLATISIVDVHGCSDELELVRYILENAKVLEKLTLSAGSGISESSKFQMLQKVSLFPRCSQKCRISFT